MRIFENIQYGQFVENILDIYLPKKKGYDTIVYFHGGGLTSGDKAEKHTVEVGKAFAGQGYGFVSVNYRMYSAVKFPEYIEDCAEAIAWVKSHIQEYGASGDIYISGSSAGGWLSLMLCLNKKYLERVGVSTNDIKGWIIDSAQTTSHFNVMKYELGCNPSLQRINEYAPLYYVDENTKFSKMLLLFYENDMPCRPEQNYLFIKAIQTFNKDADIQYKQLPGGHCHGSVHCDENGEYDFVKESVRWLKNA